MLRAMSWPSVRGKRCLAIGQHLDEISDALVSRGADQVEMGTDAHLADTPGAPFDVTVGWGVVTGSDSPLRSLRAVRSVTRGLFVSIEPVDVMLTIGARYAPLLRFLDAGSEHKYQYSMNGQAHFRLVRAAGFIPERLSKMVLVPCEDPSTRIGPIPTVVGRLLAGPGRGMPHRTLIARANP